MQIARRTQSVGARRGIGSAVVVTTVLAALTALALAAAPAHAAAGEGPSLAVLGDKPELAPLVSLVEVELSKSGVRLVERAALDRVLQEQELNAGGLADRDALVKVGRLVRADAFLLLSLEEAPAAEGAKEGLLRVRLCETAHGIRFLDRFAGFAPEKLEAAASDVARDTSAALAKLRLGPGQGVAVSVVDIHRALLGEEHQPQCRTLRGLLAARLGAEPNVVVLEREDLMRLMGEKELTGGKGEGFWGSAVLVEGRLSRAEGEQMELVLQVSPAGKEPLEVGPFAVKAEALAEAAAQGAAAVMGAVGREGGAAWQPEVEAERFYRQAMLLRSHGRSGAALPLLETAFALQPDNIEYATTVFRAGIVIGHPGGMPYTPLQAAELAGRLVYRFRDTVMQGDSADPQARHLMGALQIYFTRPASTADERVIELNRAPRKAFADLFWQRAASRASEGDLPAAARAAVRHAMVAASTPEEAVANIKDYVRRRIMPPESGGEVTSFTERCDNSVGFALDASQTLRYGTQHIFYLDYRLPNLLLPYFAELASSPDPLVALAGLIAALAQARRAPGTWNEPWKDPLDRNGYSTRARDIIQKQLQSRTNVSPAAARHMHSLLLFAPGSVFSPEEAIAIYEEFYRPLIENRDVDSLATWYLHIPLYGGVGGSYPRALAFARTAALLDQIGDVLAPSAGRPEVQEPSHWARSDSVRLKDAVRDYLDGLRTGTSRPAGTGAEEMLAQIAAIEKLLPDLAPHPPARALNVKPLVRKGDWFRPWSPRAWTDFAFCRAVYQDGVLWVCIADADKPMTLGLAGLDLKAGEVVALWQMLLQPRYLGAGDIKGLAVGVDRSYAASEDEQLGLIEFPGAGSPGRGFIENPRVLGEKDGLPVSRISGIAFWEGKLWVAHVNPEAGLGTYDPVARKWRQVFDSAVPGPTALEGKGGYELRELTASSAGLFFLGPAPGARQGGLWRLVPGTTRPEFLTLSPAPYSDRVVGTSGSACIAKYDFLATAVAGEGRTELLLIGRDAKASLARSGDQPEQKWPLVPNAFLAGVPEGDVAFGPQQFGGLDLQYAAVHGDELWAPYGEKQIAILHRGRTFKEADIIPNIVIDGERVLQFYSTPDGLVGVGRGVICLIEPGGK